MLIASYLGKSEIAAAVAPAAGDAALEHHTVVLGRRTGQPSLRLASVTCVVPIARAADGANMTD